MRQLKPHLLGCDDANVHSALFEDAVATEQLLNFIQAVRELARPVINVFHEPNGQILRDAAHPAQEHKESSSCLSRQTSLLCPHLSHFLNASLWSYTLASP